MTERIHKGDTQMPEVFQLRNGRDILIRRIRKDDAPRLSEHFSRLSPYTRRLRFFAPMRTLQVSFAERLADVDFVERAAFVAAYPGEATLRGVGRYARETDDAVEVAFVIDDDMHGLGLGTELLYHLAALARENGYTALTAQVLEEHHEMLAVVRGCGFPYQAWGDGTVIHVRLDIAGEGAEGQPFPSDDVQ
jgi:GNAT superfamily N-acetyltransferase